MCGYVISASPKLSNVADLKASNDTLLRGPDYYNTLQFLSCDLYFTFEFSHLFITEPVQNQPFCSDELIMVLNGEIYNYLDLRSRLGRDNEPSNDTGTFFKHVQRFGLVKSIELSNGMYSGFLLHKKTGECLGFTDPVGKKPLVLWNSSRGWHAGTGLDLSYVNSGTTKFFALPPGISVLNMKNGKFRSKTINSYAESMNNNLLPSLTNAISYRVPSNLPFGVTLSGGLDSSIIAYILERKLKLRPIYYTLGEEVPKSVNDLILSLEIDKSRFKLVRPSNQGDLLENIRVTVKIAKSKNPSIVSNGVATMMLARSIQKDNIRVILNGEGADEYFCGYQAMYNGKNCPLIFRNELIKNLYFTELRRIDLIYSYFGIEARCPFLDKNITQIALETPVEKLCCSQKKQGKLILRDVFNNHLPHSIISSPKEPFDVSSGLQKPVIKELMNISSSERLALSKIMHEVIGNSNIFDSPYFSEYPFFDPLIDNRARKYDMRY